MRWSIVYSKTTDQGSSHFLYLGHVALLFSACLSLSPISESLSWGKKKERKINRLFNRTFLKPCFLFLPCKSSVGEQWHSTERGNKSIILQWHPDDLWHECIIGKAACWSARLSWCICVNSNQKVIALMMYCWIASPICACHEVALHIANNVHGFGKNKEQAGFSSSQWARAREDSTESRSATR